MGNRFPSFPLYPDDWLGSHARATMSPAARAAYFDLLCHYWSSGRGCSGLILDPKVLRSLAGNSELTDQDLAIIVKQFKKRRGKLHNLKLQALYREKVAYFKASSEAGKRGAKVRWGDHKPPYKDPTISPLAKRNSSSPSPSPSTTPKVGEEGEGPPPVSRSGGTEEQLAATYQTANPGVISNDKARAQVRFHLARGVDPKAMESALFSSAGKKIWEVLDGLEGKGDKPKQASVQDMMQELGEQNKGEEIKDFFTEPK